MKRFKYVDYDKKDLVSIGIIGLIKAVDNYKLSYGTTLSTFAINCIDNEILMFLRKLKKNKNVVSLNDSIFVDNGNNDLKLEDRLYDCIDFTEDYDRLETIKIIRDKVNELSERDRKIVMLYFDFNGDRTYTQTELASMFNMTQSNLSLIITKNLKKLRTQLVRAEVIILPSNSRKKTRKRIS